MSLSPCEYKHHVPWEPLVGFEGCFVRVCFLKRCLVMGSVCRVCDSLLVAM